MLFNGSQESYQVEIGHRKVWLSVKCNEKPLTDSKQGLTKPDVFYSDCNGHCGEDTGVGI